jgi:hypothetical protein
VSSSRFTTFASLAVLTAKFYHASVLSRINLHYSLTTTAERKCRARGMGWSNAYVRRRRVMEAGWSCAEWAS